MTWNEDKNWALVVVGLFTCLFFGVKGCSDWNTQQEDTKRAAQVECLKHNSAAECRKLFVVTNEHYR